MKNALKVFRRDLKGMVKNPIAILIITGLCIIPSLYAFVNIKACWDAYTNTSQIPIAVVNSDAGAVIGGKSLNVGDNIVSQLKTNHAIDWQFVSVQQANIGLADGDYYAEIDIPSNFSANLATLTSDNPVKPELIYKVNTKLGPVANKITEVAQQNVLAQVKSSIMSTISQQVFQVLNGYGEKAAENKNEIIALKDAIINLNNNIGPVTDALNGVSTNANSLSEYLSTIKATIPDINSSLGEIQNNTSNLASIGSNTQNLINNSLKNVELNLVQSQTTLNNLSSLAGQLKDGVNTSQATDLLNSMSSNIGNANNSLTANINYLNAMAKNTGSKVIGGLVNQLEAVEQSLAQCKATVDSASSTISSGGQLATNTLSSLQSQSSGLSNSIGSAINTYNGSVKGDLSTIGNGLISATSSAAQLINDTQNLGNKISSAIGTANTGSALAAQSAKELSGDLNQYKGLISELSTKLSALSDNDINQIISVLQGNPMLMGDYISSPFNFEQETIYPVANYGSGMAPVYSVLAFWVGILLLSSLLRTETVEFEGSENMTIREKHFGKMLTFVFLGIIQSLVIALGDKFLLGVQTENLPLFIAAAVITDITFAIIIYTIVSLFRTMGKAICIVLMVIQLAGTGGTYPIQALPLIFRIIKPFMPFPYGVDTMREAIGGPYWPNVTKDIACLIAFAIIFILIGYFLKPRTNGFFTKFEGKFEESGIAE
ncbi:MAG: YhgE/Pip family protein [Sarcina sp.]